MKKKILLTICLTILTFNSVFAQRDGFFTSNYSEYREDESWGIDMPLLPGSHGYFDDYSCVEQAPLGSGVILLTALALLRLKTKKEE